MRTALIAGASGLVGGFCLAFLLECGRYDRVLALVRRPLDCGHARLRQIEVEFDRLRLYRDSLKADDIFCCLGTTMRRAGSAEAFRRVDHHYPLTLASIGRDLGAEGFFLVSSLGAHPRSPVFYLRVKGQVERAVQQLGLPRTHIFRPSHLLGDRAEKRKGERLMVRLLERVSPVLRGPLSNLRPIDAAVVARAMVQSAGMPDGFYIHRPSEIRKLASEPG